MDPREPRDLDRLEGDILDSLADLNRNLESVLNGSFEVNPADLSLDLDLGCDRLTCLLGTLDDELEGLAEAAGCELNELVREVLGNTMAGTRHPLVVTTCWGSSIPRIGAGSRLLTAAISRLLELASNYAGAGGELSLRTTRQDAGAELAIDARPLDVDASEQAGDSVVWRCRSIEHFIAGLGGQFRAERTDHGSICLRLQLAGAERLS